MLVINKHAIKSKGTYFRLPMKSWIKLSIKNLQAF